MPPVRSRGKCCGYEVFRSPSSCRMDRLVPLEELKGLLKAGMTRPDELAEYFGVPEDFLLRCVAYYKEAKGAL